MSLQESTTLRICQVILDGCSLKESHLLYLFQATGAPLPVVAEQEKNIGTQKRPPIKKSLHTSFHLHLHLPLKRMIFSRDFSFDLCFFLGKCSFPSTPNSKTSIQEYGSFGTSSISRSSLKTGVKLEGFTSFSTAEVSKIQDTHTSSKYVCLGHGLGRYCLCFFAWGSFF